MHLEPFSQERPWGDFRQFTKNQSSTVKLITVHAGEELSLQSHEHRDEFWRVIAGDPTLIIGTETISAVAGKEFFVVRNTPHQIKANSTEVIILEISLGDFDENDITRIKDKYGRV